MSRIEGSGRERELFEQPVFEYDKELLLDAVDEALQRWKTNDEYSARLERTNAPGRVEEFSDFYKLPPVDRREFKDHPRELIVTDLGGAPPRKPIPWDGRHPLIQLVRWISDERRTAEGRYPSKTVRAIKTRVNRVKYLSHRAVQLWHCSAHV